MFQRVLVPINFTDTDQQALTHALELAGEDGHITLLHVVEPIPHLDEEEDQAFYARLRIKADKKMMALVDRNRGGTVKVEGVVLLGKRWERIVGFSKEHDTRLIVMSSHRLDRDRHPVLLGSVSHRVAVMAPCPILLLK